MKIKTADYLVKRLAELGIKDIFGLPGDYNFNMLDAIINNPDVNWINCTNELNAGYAADGYARINGYGAVVTTYGVGELSATNAIAGSYAENIPVIKITGAPKTSFINSKALIHHNFSKPDYYAFEKTYSNIVETTAYLNKDNAKEEIDRLIETMIKTKKPVYLVIPMDICHHMIDDKIPEVKIKSDNNALNDVTEKISCLINSAKNPLIITDYLIKRYRLQNEVRDFINKYNINITSMIMGKGIVNEDDKHYIGINHGPLAENDFIEFYKNVDLTIGFGTLFSDLNTLGFAALPDDRFRIDIQADYAIVDGERFENVLINDVIEKLLNSNMITPKDQNSADKPFKGYKNIEVSNTKIRMDEIFPLLQNFLKSNDTVVIETGIIGYASSKMKLGSDSNYISQPLWGSIGWATPALFGASMADKSKRPILFTGEGSHQLTIQEMANLFKYDIKPVILLLNNKGYTIERYLSNNFDDVFNDITSWDYKKALELFSLDKKEFAYHSAHTSNELKEALSLAQNEQKEKLVYIEIFTDKADIPTLMKKSLDFIKSHSN